MTPQAIDAPRGRGTRVFDTPSAGGRLGDAARGQDSARRPGLFDAPSVLHRRVRTISTEPAGVCLALTV